jgi:hypothetical protein
MIPVRPKTSYHPFILIAFYLNCLPESLLGSIPKSTRFDWQHRNLQDSFGFGWYQENKDMFLTLELISQHKKLLKINKALLRVIALRSFIKKHSAALVAAGSSSIKVAVLENIHKVTQVFGLRRALKYIDLDFRNYSKIRSMRSCPTSLYGLCFIKHPTQLLEKEIAVIKTYCADDRFLHWPLISVYHQMKKDGASYLSSSTFYKYAKLLKLERLKAFSRRKNHQIGIRASKPLEIIHADATILKLKDNSRAFIYLVQDNFSRTILSYRCARENGAQFSLENLENVYQNYLFPSGIKNCSLITDDGSENYGEASKFSKNCQSPEIAHLIAQKTIRHSNSMIEAANKQIKYHFLYHKEINNLEQLEVYLPLAIKDYNHRPHDSLNGLSPFETLNGKLPTQVSYTNHIAKARLERMNENRIGKCCSFSF